ncbi:MAG: M48 family metallopeptidase [Saprospiraceae bacterium]|nr:M48 family metallopeptidase [Saprospiraceae bacterium]
MADIGLQSQIWRNNRTSLALLVAFPVLLVGLLWVVLFFAFKAEGEWPTLEQVNHAWLLVAPFLTGFVIIWFLVAWMSYGAMLRRATSARPMERKEDPRLYNLLENLCMSRGIPMPTLQIIDDDSLNAYASGLSKKTFSIAVSRGLVNKLDDVELEAVLAHELSHIRNRDVRMMMISIIFVGIFAFLAEMAARTGSRPSGGNKKDRGGGLVIILVIFLAYLISMLLRFAISRRREFLADAGAVELTKNAPALASALRKISADPYIEAVTRDDVAQLFIQHPRVVQPKPNFLTKVFATHPPIEERIKVLENW